MLKRQIEYFTRPVNTHVHGGSKIGTSLTDISNHTPVKSQVLSFFLKHLSSSRFWVRCAPTVFTTKFTSYQDKKKMDNQLRPISFDNSGIPSNSKTFTEWMIMLSRRLAAGGEGSWGRRRLEAIITLFSNIHQTASRPSPGIPCPEIFPPAFQTTRNIGLEILRLCH